MKWNPSVIHRFGKASVGTLAMTFILCGAWNPTPGAPQGTGGGERKGLAQSKAGQGAPQKPAPKAVKEVTAPPLPGIKPQVISHLAPARKVIALTFDACETEKPAGYDTAIIRILRETHTPATLLLGGHWMETHPDATRDLARDALFELGNHSYLHPHMKKISEQRVSDEIRKPQDILYRLTGKQGALFRPPYGEYNDATVKSAAQLGLKILMWNIVTGDPDPNVSAKEILHTVLSQAKPGSIVIMHVNGRGRHTAEALPALISKLHAQGYIFVKVSDALP